MLLLIVLQVYASQYTKLASLEGASFLYELLPKREYLALFDEMNREAATRSDALLCCRALTCLSYYHMECGDTQQALATAEQADGIARTRKNVLEDTEFAFTLYCLGRAVWKDGVSNARSRKKGDSGSSVLKYPSRSPPPCICLDTRVALMLPCRD